MNNISDTIKKYFTAESSAFSNDAVGGDNLVTAEGELRSLTILLDKIANAKEGTALYRAKEDLAKTGRTDINNLLGQVDINDFTEKTGEFASNLIDSQDDIGLERFAQNKTFGLEDINRIIESFAKIGRRRVKGGKVTYVQHTKAVQELQKDLIAAARGDSSRLQKYKAGGRFKQIDQNNSFHSILTIDPYNNKYLQSSEEGGLGPEYLLYQDKGRALAPGTDDVYVPAQELRARASQGNLREVSYSFGDNGSNKTGSQVTVNSDTGVITFKDHNDKVLYEIDLKKYGGGSKELQAEFKKAYERTGIKIEGSESEQNNWNQVRARRRARKKKRWHRRAAGALTVAAGTVTSAFGAILSATGVGALVGGAGITSAGVGLISKGITTVKAATSSYQSSVLIDASKGISQGEFGDLAKSTYYQAKDNVRVGYGVHLGTSGVSTTGHRFETWNQINLKITDSSGKGIIVGGITKHGTTDHGKSGLSVAVVANGVSEGQAVGLLVDNKPHNNADKYIIENNPELLDIGEGFSKEEYEAKQAEEFEAFTGRIDAAFEEGDIRTIGRLINELETFSGTDARDLQITIIEKINETKANTLNNIESLQEQITAAKQDGEDISSLNTELSNAEKLVKGLDKLLEFSDKHYSTQSDASDKLGLLNASTKKADELIAALETEKFDNESEIQLASDPATINALNTRNQTIELAIEELKKQVNNNLEFANLLKQDPDILSAPGNSELLESIISFRQKINTEITTIVEGGIDAGNLGAILQERDKYDLAMKALFKGGSTEDANRIIRNQNSIVEDLFNDTASDLGAQINERIKEIELEGGSPQERETAYILLNLINDIDTRSKDLKLASNINELTLEEEDSLVSLLQQRKGFIDQTIEAIAANNDDGRDRAKELVKELEIINSDIDTLLSDADAKFKPKASNVKVFDFLYKTSRVEIQRFDPTAIAVEGDDSIIDTGEQFNRLFRTFTDGDFFEEFVDIEEEREFKLSVIRNLFDKEGIPGVTDKDINEIFYALNKLANGEGAEDPKLYSRITYQIERDIKLIQDKYAFFEGEEETGGETSETAGA